MLLNVVIPLPRPLTPVPPSELPCRYTPDVPPEALLVNVVIVPPRLASSWTRPPALLVKLSRPLSCAPVPLSWNRPVLEIVSFVPFRVETPWYCQVAFAALAKAELVAAAHALDRALHQVRVVDRERPRQVAGRDARAVGVAPQRTRVVHRDAARTGAAHHACARALH